jgi:putative flippase GtrA
MASSSQLPLIQKLWILMRSSMIGVMATACDLSTLLLLMWVFHLPEKIANIPSLIPGLIVMFFGNKYFAFEDHSKQVVRQGARFLYVETWAFIINVLLFNELVTEFGFQEHQPDGILPGWMMPLLARMIGTAITYFTFSFPFWTFIFHKTTVEQVEHEKFIEQKRQEVAAKLSSLHWPSPIAPAEGPPSNNGAAAANEAVKKTAGPG